MGGQKLPALVALATILVACVAALAALAARGDPRRSRRTREGLDPNLQAAVDAAYAVDRDDDPLAQSMA